jgi:signal transduction histidine kinase/ligand-binding sensor domain-containing protein/DNA-binding response OmpR family regulator
MHHSNNTSCCICRALRGGVISFVLMALSPGLISAQDALLPVFHFKRIAKADGLPTDKIYSRVYRDATGFVWIGTYNGLSRFDGYGFKHYRNIPGDASSISSNIIIMLREDSRHRFWVGTWDAGLSLYDRKHDRFVNFRPRPGDSSWIQTRTIFSMAEDSSGNLWLGTGLGGTIEIIMPEQVDPQDIEGLAHGIRFRTYALGTPRNVVNELCAGPDGSIYVASDRGLLQLDPRSGVISRPHFAGPLGQLLDSIDVYRIIRDHQGDFWVATSTDGLFRIEWRTGTIRNYRHSEFDSLSIVSNSIADIAEDRHGNLWIATAQGIDLFSATAGKRRPYLTSGLPLRCCGTMDLAVDRRGSLWVSTGDNGVYCLEERSLRFPHYARSSPHRTSLGFESIERAPDGQIWICSYGSALNVDVETHRVVRSIDILRGARALGWQPSMRTSMLDRFGILWYGVWGSGLYRINLAAGRVKNFRYLDPLSDGEIVVWGIAPDPGNCLWIAAAHDGLRKFDLHSATFTRVSDARVSCVLADRSGSVWQATDLDGLYVLNSATGTTCHFVHDPGDPRSLSSDRAQSIYEDPSGRIWVGATNVLNLWVPESRSFTRYINLGILDANVGGAIGSDRKGRLWVAYDAGRVAMFMPATGIFVNFDTSNGICGDPYDMENLDDGRILLTGSGGLNIFDPESALDNQCVAPTLLITGMAVNDTSISPPHFVDGTSDLQLSHDQNVVELEFAALDTEAPQFIQYSYRLDGLESEWTETKGRRYVRYPGLRPGEYVFRLKASSARNEWPAQEIALAIRIAPPWWRSEWAYGAYALLFAAFVGAAYRLRVKQLRLQQRAEMEHFQAERLAEVDRVKSRFFANVSHEFRTPLTLILGPAERVIETTREEATRRQLHLIRDNTNRLRALVNQLLYFSRLESGSMKLQISCGDVAQFLRRVVMSFESWAERKKINLEFHSELDSMMGLFDTEKLEKIVNNLVSNAVKFTTENGMVNVQVAQLSPHPPPLVREEERGGELVTISVFDTGPGIALEHLPHIFDRFYRVDETHTTEGTGIGLALTKELVELHHGTISVESTPGKGSVFTVTFPIDEASYKREEITDFPVEIEKRQQSEAGGPADESRTDRLRAPSAEGKPIVLVVEDNADLRTYIREFLECDYAVQEGGNGKEGLERAVEIVPDLVISDVMMPEMDGMELCRALKQDVRTSHVPVILLTARAGTDNKIEGLGIGADDYVTKPFEIKELLARVRNLIDQRRLLRSKFSAGVVLRPGEVAVSSLDDTLLKNVMNVIEQRMGDENLSAEEIARDVALSRRHLDRKLVSLTNLSISELVQYMRLQRARDLLEKRVSTVAEIAFQVGFRSPSYFTACYRERFGCLPSEVQVRIE